MAGEYNSQEMEHAKGVVNSSCCPRCGNTNIQMKFLPHQPNDPVKNWVIYNCPNCAMQAHVTTNILPPSSPSSMKNNMGNKKIN